MIATQQGRPQQAVDLVDRALALRPADAGFHLSRGVALQFLGRREEAIACFQEALGLQPQLPHAHNNLANALYEQGKHNEALEHWRQAVTLQPDYADAHRNLGHVLAELGHFDAALPHAREALRLNDQDHVAHRTVGAVLTGREDWNGAAASYREALRLRPQWAEAHCDLAHVLQKQGKLTEAIVHLQLAIQLHPQLAQAYNEFGIIRGKEGQPAEAVLHFEQALRLRPEYPEAHHNLALILKGQRRYDEAITHFRAALRLRPDFGTAATHLADLLGHLGKTDEALEVLREACERAPLTSTLLCTLGMLHTARGQLAEGITQFRETLRLRPDDAVAHSCLLEALNYDPEINLDELYIEHQRWAEAHGNVPALEPAARHERNSERRLRVGYVSGDFRQHIAAQFIEPILAHHDPQKVEVFCYADVAAPDHRTAQLQTLAPHWRPISGRPDEEVARQVRDDQVDILVDLMGHTGTRLGVFARRPAPVQVTYLGYPHTTGLETIHYRLTDAVCDPLGEPERHREQLIRLPGGFCCYAPPPDAPAVNPLPASRSGYVTFGSTHKLAKLNSRVLDLWAALLQAIPMTRMLLFRDTLQGSVVERLQEEFGRRGVNKERLQFRHSVPPGESLLSVYHEVDILLDVFPWCGHATACEALWMGVPVLTLKGNRHAGRMTASVLTQTGLTEWIVKSGEEWVEMGRTIAGRIDELGLLRVSLRDKLRKSPLCDGQQFTRLLEEAYWETSE